MKKYILYCMIMVTILSGIYNISYADFLSAQTFTALVEDYDSIKVYDGVGNDSDIAIYHTAPTVSEPTYSGDNYQITIHDDAGIWKVEDGNDPMYEIDNNTTYDTTVSRSIYGVEEITIYNHAGDTTVKAIETVTPTIVGPTYDGDNYVITISDPGDTNGTGSGIWKVEDDNGVYVRGVDLGFTTLQEGGFQFTKPINGVTYITVYDKAGNYNTVYPENLKPIIEGPTYSGINYTITISDLGDTNGTGSGIWKVEDDNGVYVRATDPSFTTLQSGGIQFTKPIEDVTYITVYDKAGNYDTVYPENVNPTIALQGYTQGNYVVAVSDAGEDNGTGSGVWKIQDTNGTDDTISSGTVTRPKTVNPETVYLYDRANNVSTLIIDETSTPIVEVLYKEEDATAIRLKVRDENVNLWKVTESIGGSSIADLSGQSCTVEFNLTDTSVSTIYIYNHAGNYTTVDLAQYEESRFIEERTFTNIGEGDSGIKVFDGVGNILDVPLDNIPPTVSTPTYSGDNYNIVVSDNDSGIWKVVDANGTDDTVTAGTIARSVYGVNDITVYDHANNTTKVWIETTPPTISSPSYSQGNYVITVSDPGESNGTGSGIWKLKDSNGTVNIPSGTITMPKISGKERVWVHDKANNITAINLSSAVPTVTGVTKKAKSLDVTLSASDSNVALWKVTEDIGGKPLAALSGSSCTASFTLPTNNIRTLYVYNHANNYTAVDLASYETFDTVDPIISEPLYKEGNYIITLKDSDSGIWKLVYGGDTDYVSDGTITRPVPNGIQTVYVYDNSNVSDSVILTTTGPTIVSVHKEAGSRKVMLTAQDDKSDLWKITESIGSNEIAKLSGRSCTVSFDVSEASVSKLYVYNHAGYYTQVNLSEAEDIFSKTYTMYSEEYASGFRIYDMTGNYLEYPVTDTTAPNIVGNVYKNAAGTAFKLEVQDEGGLFKITDSNDNLIEYLSETSWETNFMLPSEISGLKVYDVSGNNTSITSFSEDVEAPSVTKSTGSTILVQDDEAGVWKITNGDGSVVLKDYSDSFPTDSQSYTVPVMYESIRVYDAVNNYRSMTLRKEISEATTITTDEPNGLKITEDCTITFNNTSEITIGNTLNSCAGIEIAPGVTLTIENTGSFPVNIYGGSDGIYKFAGIYVPANSSLNITGSGTTNVYGKGDGTGTAAGIGGHGITISSSSTDTSLANAGTINISGGTVNAYGGISSCSAYGTGAGIGGGGIHNAYKTSVAGSNVANVVISSNATVVSKGGCCTNSDGSFGAYGTGAGIGGGGLYNEVATDVTGGNLSAGTISTSGNVTSIGGYSLCKLLGSGAGIGGGGIYNALQATITGGDLTSTTISAGEIRAIGGHSDHTDAECRGTGAGIGGGGIVNMEGESTITGGNIASMEVTGGTVYAYGGRGKIPYGTGAGVGGGGVASLKTATITAGEITALNVSNAENVIATKGKGVNVAYGVGANVGQGGVYNSGTDEASEAYTDSPDVTRAYKKGTTAIITASDLAHDLDKITESTEDEAPSLVTFTRESQTVVFTLSSSDVSTVYVYNKAGNYTKVTLEEDTTKPTVTGHRNGAQYIITSQDSEAGLRKVTSEDGSVTLQDYAEYVYPTTQHNLTIPQVYDKVLVYDAVGNYETKEFRDAYPQATIYVNSTGTKFKVEASDDFGLSKVTSGDGSTTYATLTGNSYSKHLEFYDVVTSFKVYDSENKSITVDSSSFITDSDAPTVEVIHNGTNYVLTMTDSVSGIWKVTDATNDSTVVDYETNMPTDTVEYVLTEVCTQINVYDGVGNITPVSLKKEISEDTVISQDEVGGIKVLASCKITFSNTAPIVVGSVNNPHAGIELVSGATLTIESTTNNMVNIYGGHGTDEYGSIIKYAGINVPTGATLNLEAGNTIKAYGYGDGDGTAAGIGGNGVTVASSSSVPQANAGTVNISSGTVYAYGGYSDEVKCGTGAGIGGGGVFNSVVASLTGGEVSTVNISGGIVHAYGGSSSGDYETYGTGAGIGGGGIWDNKATGSLIGGNVGTINVLDDAVVDALGGFTAGGEIYGTGAGIGGGGLYHETSYATITGGGITSGVTVSTTGFTRAVGGYSSTSNIACGTGAGVGGGGIYSTAGDNVAGGSVAKAAFRGSGMVTVNGGFGSSISKATGAHLGGGGVYTVNNAANVRAGELCDLEVSHDANITTFNFSTT